jgi:hypothetical protein
MVEFDAQIKRVRELVTSGADQVRLFHAPFNDEEQRQSFDRHIGLSPRGGGRPSIVFADDCAVELGAPQQSSINLVLWTHDRSLVNDGEIRLIGPDMATGAGVSWPYAQVILLAWEGDNEIDPFALESTQLLSNRLPGFMVRAVPSRLWVRISHEAIKGGLCFHRLGGALISAYRQDYPAVRGVEVLFVTAGARVTDLEPVNAEARILMGKNMKLVLVGDGTYECTELNCDACEEKATCDAVRDIVILRRGSEA